LNVNVWGAEFFASVLKSEVAKRALEIINVQRNNLAHGRQTLSLTEIKGLVTQGLRLAAWPRVSESDGEFQLPDWIPWLRALSPTAVQIRLFERWQTNVFRYLVPETGEVFKVPRKSIA
jgi:hypothetical protein